MRLLAQILSAQGAPDFPEQICRGIYEAIPSVRVCLGQIDRRFGRFRASYWPHVSAVEQRRLLRTFGLFALQHPRLRAFLSGRRLSGVVDWRELDPDGSFFDSELYRRFYQPYRVTAQLSFPLPAPRRPAIGVTVDRADGDFTDYERAFLDALRHRLSHVFIRATNPSMAHAVTALGWGMIEIDEMGEIINLNDTAKGSLAHYRIPVRPGSQIGDTPLGQVVQPLLKRPPLLADPAEAEAGGSSAFHSLSWAGGELLLEVPQIGHLFVYLNVQHAAEPPEPRIRADTVLTERQAEIAELLIQGLSNKEIATALTISPLTVRTHIQAIYERLGVTSRAAAVAALLNSR